MQHKQTPTVSPQPKKGLFVIGARDRIGLPTLVVILDPQRHELEHSEPPRYGEKAS